ncbi:MAG: hypothetical protein PHU21_03865 [Elusimicrobia bacterium]|nr:hypothetical protein [Elusimicrobiota bacterium]
MDQKKAGIAAILVVASNVLFLAVVFHLSRCRSAGMTGPAWGATGAVVTRQSLPAYLEGLAAMKDLPDDANIQLRFYRSASGMRVQENSYVIRKGVAGGEALDADLEVLLDSKYIPELGAGLCPAIRKARANRDMGFNIRKNSAALLWKYRGVLKYKDCFGF